jgi:hypothetical protein
VIVILIIVIKIIIVVMHITQKLCHGDYKTTRAFNAKDP